MTNNNFGIEKNMEIYHEKIKEIKEKGPIDILKFEFNEKPCSLRMVDTSDETINLLSKWRKGNWDGFDSKFNVTFNGTKKWLDEQILKNSERALFLIIYDGRKIGQWGMSGYDPTENSVWVIDLIRGEKNVAPGIMTIIDKIYFKWIFDTFKLSKIKLKVFSDNFRTINLHSKTCMNMVDIIPFKRTYTDDGWKWETKELKSDTEYGERYFIIMEITKEKLLENFNEKTYKNFIE